MSIDRVNRNRGLAEYAKMKAPKPLAPGSLAAGAPKIEPTALGAIGSARPAERVATRFTIGPIQEGPDVFTDVDGSVHFTGA